MSKRRSVTLGVLFALLVAATVIGIPENILHAQQSAKRLTILLTNDDGYGAPGLVAMQDALKSVADVYVTAPAEDQSGKGHSIDTGRAPIMVREYKQADGKSWYAMDSTPATCARMGIETLLPHRPDLVISGINRGENLGIVVYYSGTLGAAREAALVGIAAIAVSNMGISDKDYAATAAYIRDLVLDLQSKGLLKPGLFLNVNAPAGESKGVRVTRQSVRATGELYEKRTNPRGRTYYWSDWRPLADDEDGTDVHAIVHGYISVTPMSLDTTAREAMGALKILEKAKTSAAK